MCCDWFYNGIYDVIGYLRADVLRLQVFKNLNFNYFINQFSIISSTDQTNLLTSERNLSSVTPTIVTMNNDKLIQLLLPGAIGPKTGCTASDSVTDNTIVLEGPSSSEEELDEDDQEKDTPEISTVGDIIPKEVKHSAFQKSAAQWKFFHKLHVPYEVCGTTSNRNKATWSGKSKREVTKISKTSICMLCIEDLKTKKCTPTSWRIALGNVNTPANALCHLQKKHVNHPGVKKLTSQSKQRLAERVDAVQNAVMGPMNKHVVRMNKDALRHDMLDWWVLTCITKHILIKSDLPYPIHVRSHRLIYDSVPYNTIQSPRFTKMFKSLLDFKPMARETFINLLEVEFDKFIEKVVELLTRVVSLSFGRNFAQVLHDMWTSGATNNCMGSGISFVDDDFNWYFISCMLVVNNTSHGSKFNADLLREMYQDRFGMDISSFAKFMGSDTTNAATAVSRNFDRVEQVNCEMHVLNLVLQYGIGDKEHYRTVNKVRTVVSVGGKFEGGAHILLTLRAICVYFGTPQRKNQLNVIQSEWNLPIGKPAYDGATRVSSVHELLSTTLLHYYSMQQYYEKLQRPQAQKKKDKFGLAWESLTPDHWQLVAEIEAMMRPIAKYSMGASQRTGCPASEIIVWRKIALGVVDAPSFKCLPRRRWDADTTGMLMDTHRVELSCTSLSAMGTQCLKRLKEEVRVRFEDRSNDPEELVVILLDPRTAPFLHKLVLSNGVADEVKECLVSCVRETMFDMAAHSSDEGREATELTQTQEGDEEEKGMDVHGQDPFNFFLPTSATPKSLLAEGIVDQWLAYCATIDWHTFQNVSGGTQLSPKIGLMDLIQFVDPFKWFRRNKGMFPQISLLAREYFAKMDSSAIQERMFSAAQAAMSKQQTRMDPEHHEKRTVLHENRDFLNK